MKKKISAAFVVISIFIAVIISFRPGFYSVSANDGASLSKKRKITDSTGRVVEIPEKVRRVAPINASLRFLVYMRGLDRVAGVENIDKNFINTRPYTIAAASKIKDLPVISEGGMGKPVDYEKLISLAPDVIFEAFSDRDQADAIQQKTGIPVISLSYGDSSWCSEEVVFNSLRIVGEVIDEKTRAVELIKYIEGLDADLAGRSAKISEDKRVLAYVGAISFRGAQGITSSDPEFIPFVKTGAKNAAREIGKKGHIFLDREKILLWDPEFIFIDAGGLPLVSDDHTKNPQYYTSLKAVANDRTYLLMPSVFYFLNVETLYANSFFVGKTIYPEIYADVDVASKADEIFEFFTGSKCYSSIKKETGAPGKLEFSKDGVKVE